MASNKETFKAGDEVYDNAGNLAIYVSKAFDGHIIRYQHDQDSYSDGTFSEPRLSEPMLLSLVYTSAPTIRKSQEIESLSRLIDEKRKELSSLQLDIRGQQSELTRLKDRFAQVPAMRRIEDFIDGKITHFVIDTGQHGSISVQEKNIALRNPDEDRYERDTKLLTLFGKTNGDLQWKLNSYSDGSGDYSDVYLFHSLEEATKFARDLIARRLEESDLNRLPWGIQRLLDSATAFNVPIPSALKSRLRELKEGSIRTRIAKANDELAQSQKELLTLTQENTDGLK